MNAFKDNIVCIMAILLAQIKSSQHRVIEYRNVSRLYGVRFVFISVSPRAKAMREHRS